MAFWSVREELSQANRLRRSYYELLRDELDQFLIKYALIDSYCEFRSKRVPYPFVEKRELKPRARIPDKEYESQNAFLVIFVEDVIPAAHKKYIRFLDVNRATKTNLLRSKTLQLTGRFDGFYKYFKSPQFFPFLETLLPVDYALLIQRDPKSRARVQYCLTHFHVRIDWPISDAAEDLARSLRYISKDIYEKGDKYAEDIQKKYFEYYGLPVMAGGRRTATIVAAQYLKRNPCITTVYAGSSESRALMRISERGVSKFVLMEFSDADIAQIQQENSIRPEIFEKNYLVDRNGKSAVCIFQVAYALTSHARPPDDGKLRDLKPDLNWLTVGSQHLLPSPNVRRYPPIPCHIIYS